MIAEPNGRELLAQANSAYQAENFEQAIALYEKVIEQKLASPDLYLNLGTAHYRNESPGRAALWYRRAELLDPDMPEVSRNLEVLKQEFGHHDFKSEAWHHWLVSVPSGVLSLLAWAAIWLALFIILMIIFVNRPNAKPLLIVLLLFSISTSVSLFYIKHYRDNHLAPYNFATVTDARSKAMVSPAPDSEPVIDLPEGSEVKILQNTGPWLYVTIPGDHLGWVHHSSIEINWPISISKQ